MKYKNWDDESDDYIPFQKVSKKPKTVKTDKKRIIKSKQREKQKQREGLESNGWQ